MPGFLSLLPAVLVVSLLSGKSGSCPVDDLKCEYTVRPLAMDEDQPRFTWCLKDNGCQKSFTIYLSTDSLSLATSPMWKSKRIESNRFYYSYAGPVLEPLTRYYWGVSVETCDGSILKMPVSYFETGMRSENEWFGSWIYDGKDPEYKPTPVFQKKFEVNKAISSAKCYLASAGIHGLFLNGIQTSTEFLNPIFTDFSKRILYNTYDITGAVKNGENHVEVWLGNGWYNHQPLTAWSFSSAPWRGRPKFILNIIIDYHDGQREVIPTDASWKTRDSPVRLNSIYVGEFFDQRYDNVRTSTTQDHWEMAKVVEKPDVKIKPQNLPPIIKKSIGGPETFIRNDANNYLIKFKKNIAGIVELRIPPVNQETKIELIHGEVTAGGRVTNDHLTEHYYSEIATGKFQTDVLSVSTGNFTYSPLFSYKGFNYLEINTDIPVTFNEEDVEAFFIHSDLTPVGKFESSNTLLNDIWNASITSFLSNMVGFPTDCPQREKNGWTGDGHLTTELGLFNFEMIKTYEKWMLDHQDAQRASGELPMIIPTPGWGYHNSTFDWTCSAVFVPWSVYLFTGDDRIIKDNYKMMKRFMDHWESRSNNYLISSGLGDWSTSDAESSIILISSLYYYQASVYMERMAEILGKVSDGAKYWNLAKKIKKAVNNQFFDKKSGYYANGYQLEQSLPLEMNIVPVNEVERVRQHLIAEIQKEGGSLNAGILGAKSIPMALSRYGNEALAYQLATRTEKPSWGYWIKNGSTTLREGWGFGGSGNHAYFGSIVSWFYRVLGGINPVEDYPGFEKISFTPFMPDDMDFVKTSFSSVRGQILSAWEKSKNGVDHHVLIPGNSTANYQIPKGYYYSGLQNISKSGSYRPFYNQDENSLDFKSGEYLIELTDSSNIQNNLNILFNGSDKNLYHFEGNADEGLVKFGLSVDNAKLADSLVDFELVYQHPADIFYIRGDTLLGRQPVNRALGANYQVTIKATCSDHSIEEFFTVLLDKNEESTFSLFPNPVEDELTIRFTNGPTDYIEYQIYSVDGRVYAHSFYKNKLNELKVNVAHLPPGMFIIRLSYEDRLYNLKFIK